MIASTKFKRYIVIGGLAAVLSGCAGEPPEVGTLDPVYVPPAELVDIRAIARNQTLGSLLYSVMDGNEQAAFLLAFQEHWSPRRMKTGTEVTFRYLPEGRVLRGVDVAIDKDQTVRLDRDDFGWRGQMIQTPIYIDTIYTSGEITSSLWDAVVYNEALSELTVADRNALIDALDRVFQWQVDFSRQQRVGDTYRFAFEREVRPDGTMRAGRLLAAEYVNMRTAYHAIYFDPNDDGQGSYFDLNGESVRRAFLLKPLEFRRISGRFVANRFHPVLQRWRAHRGIDYAADAGTPVMSTSDGVITHRGWKGSYGNMVEVRAPNGYVTRYAHLRDFRSGQAVGTRVRQSDVIGYVGMTGLATGPHLHYEMLKQSGEHIDPLSVDLPPGDPVPSQAQDRWDDEMTVRLSLIESIPAAGPVRTFISETDDAQQQPQPDENDSGADG